MGIDVESNEMEVNEMIEGYILELGLAFEEVQPGLWLIHDEIDYIDNIVVYHTAPVLTFRVKLMEAPENEVAPELYKRLLQLNASSMVAGAYGLEDEAVVIVESLQSSSLDQNEFQAAIDAITLAVREHYHELKAIVAPDDGAKKEPAQAADQA